MSPSSALWLVGILTVVTGLVIWRVLAGGRTTAGPSAPKVEGGPVTATPPATDVVEPGSAPAEAEQPVTAEAEPVAVAAEAEAEAEAEPVAVETEPVAVEAEPVAVEAEPASTETAPVAVETEPDLVAADVEPATAPAEQAAPATIPAPRASVENSTAATQPVAAPAASGPADDFQKIQGIGPKMAAGIQAAGIRTYQQLAELDEAALREVLKAAGLRAAPGLATWPQQAKVLAGTPAEAENVPATAGADA
ncbi:helix-hairpin-helix domain-containing protein [Micromonospora sp. NPDC048999]|uniref:helix-hairpin-helix domain-containing protein n=1 Tax=Micromonospora sp. NPDC048999 TaxID=3155391 RepID=UPI0033E407B0